MPKDDHSAEVYPHTKTFLSPKAGRVAPCATFPGPVETGAQSWAYRQTPQAEATRLTQNVNQFINALFQKGLRTDSPEPLA